ncbi:hypothetical protein P170DRAFT_397986 [Aspergillus steynii IBT 23096]|uniref:Uncharacterized protein n=1 Tax=Aspergillus steynii IBT 23096 TaxID=1392250 RepID=A0A2I2GNL0_9EURO|nr:uncharacterized protein P170DRAFT_397986 [Aspergillus steynii IBT 23096]PLB54472.1 hypothetical protein P170DRAFT_397986 [Aspergillus steynii IBT 23096]
MGRQAYLNRLALGRSPYEAPERPQGPTAELAHPAQRRRSALHADDYVQHYDERGHPVNPESKVFGRQLRRAKNDILSTMGIVVSEDGTASGPTEQQRADMLAAENDYGLVMATIDQVSVFLGGWWASSLAGRIQTFKSYTHAPLSGIISYERAFLGVPRFYFAGIPAWAMSTCLSICRHHPLERLISLVQSQFPDDDLLSKTVRASFNVLHSATRGTLLVLAVQTYMFSLLQSLHLVPSSFFPAARFLIPFGDMAAIQFPSLPTDFSLQSLGEYCLTLAKAPSLLLYAYMYLRPVIEIRLYRLIRRRLPKPTLADELSIKVATDNDLIDWMVPTLGRRSEEENRRNNMSFGEDIMYEVNFLRRWVLSWFGFKSQRAPRASEQVVDARRRREWLESLPLSVEQLSNERQTRARQLQLQSTVPPPPEEVIRAHAAASGTPAADLGDIGSNRVLPSEENPISQSPAEMSAGEFPDLAPLDRVNAVSPANGTPAPVDDAEDNHREHASESRRSSRSNTLFSRPSSPATSSPTSPRVRASLIHQNSDVITMQLELLGNRNTPNNGQLITRAAVDADQANATGIPTGRRSFSDLLDALLANQGQNITAIVNPDTVDSDGLSNLTAAISPEGGESPLAISPHQINPRAETPGNGPEPVSTLASILPDSVEEPGPEDNHDGIPDPEPLENDFDSEIYPRISDPNVREQTAASTSSSIAHRVTILSSHPVDSLASHLATMITGVLFLPLESLYLRSVASAFLSSIESPPGLSSDVRDLGAWGGGGSRADIAAYMGKMVLMLGMQAAVNASVWGIVSGAAIKIGRKFCGWGTL